MPQSLSVVIPCYNETKTLETVLDRVLAAETLGLRLEVIVVDDGSTDGSADLAEQLAARDARIRLLRQPRNAGKGAALRVGLAAATGDILAVQDADLEYSPKEYPNLLRPFLEEEADVVYGSRFRGGASSRVLYFWHSLGNKLLTGLSNMMTDLNLTDMECGYKLFRRDVIARIQLCEDRFGIEPELTAKIARVRPRLHIYEVGISYRGRTYAEGKKINWKDGVRAFWCILRYNVTN